MDPRRAGASTILSRGGGTDAHAAGPTLEQGAVVAGYVVESLAGAGGMGVVYRAADPELGRQVALKLIAPQRAEDPRFRELFVRESLVAAGLEHPNVIPIYRAGEDEGRLYIAMRYVEGASLQELIAQRGRVPPGRAARVVARVADALDAAHARGLVHRDVKPANVLIADPDGDEHVYLTDFGLSAGISVGRDGAPSGWAGTLAYLAPEQIRGGPIDARTDVYALGCVLFHALTGRPPFATGDEAAALEAHLTQAPPRLADAAPDLPPALDEVVRRAMAKRPEDRFETAGELGRAALAARYDVAILRADGDAAAAEEIAARLEEAGLQPLVQVAGGPRAVAEGVGASSACVVLVGREGLGEWAREGLAAAKEIGGRDRAFRKVLVLLPGGPEPVDPSLAFLATNPWIDLRAGVADPQGVDDLVRVLRGAEVGPGLAQAPADASPYRGLEAFREEDADLYFGREEDVSRLVERLRGTRFLAVLGASGSGKSSLVAAGLIPAVRRGALPGGESWRVLSMAPGARPLAALAASLRHLPGSGSPSAADLAADERCLDLAVARAAEGRPADHRVLVVVDQLEEAFTLCQDEGERSAFFGNLMYAASIPGGRTVVVVAMRADFYGRLAEHPELRSIVAAQQVLLGPLDARGLRRAIERPAARAGLELEPGLTRRILADVSDRPGTLPLMEHLLLEVWQRRRGRTLTLEAYAASGGVEGALARRANSIYGAMSPERQAVARRILLRLTQPGEGTEDTRRRATRSELITRQGEEEEVDAVVGALAEARLLTTSTDEATGQPVVDVTHEALIRGWPELRGWINDDREQLRLHRRLSDAATEWDGGGRDDGQLYRGAPLALWEGRDEADLNELERSFLVASRDRAERERASRRKRTRITIGALGIGLAIVAVLGILALISRQDATDQRDVARSRQLATESRTELATDPELATLLAAEAYDTASTSEAEAALRQSVHDSRVRGALDFGADSRAQTVVPSGDGRLVVGDYDGALRLWDPARDPRGASAATLGTRPGGLNVVAATGDGYLTAGDDGAVVAWSRSPGGPAPRVVARSPGAINALRVSDDGRRVLTAGESGVVEHDLATGRRRTITSGFAEDAIYAGAAGGVFANDEDGRLLRFGPGDASGRQVAVPGTVQSLGVSADGRLLGAGTAEGLVVLRLGEPPKVVFTARFPAGITSVVFGPDGVIAASGGDGSVRVLNSSGAVVSRMTGHAGVATDVTFLGPDRVATTGDSTARVWAWRDGQEPRLPVEALPASNGGVAFLPDGRVAVAQADGSVGAWTPPAPLRTLASAGPAADESAAVSADGRLIATGAGDGTLVVREVGGPRIGTWALGNLPVQLAWTPDGRTVAAALLGGKVVAVDIGTRAGPRVLGSNSQDALTVASRPGDGTIASAGRIGDIRLWDGTDGGRVIADLGVQTYGLAFSPDGRRLAAAVGDDTVRVYDLTGADEPIVLRGRFGAPYAVSFGGDGETLAVGGERGLRIWDWRRGVILLTAARPNAVNFLAAAGAEPRVASYGFDNVVHLTTCDVCGPIDDVLALVPRRTARSLTAEERTDFKTDG